MTTDKRSNDTREQFLDKAETLFAERGFYGVSIAAVAGELGLTKQALLHHFGSKEKIYGEVLRRISEQFAELAPGEVDDDPSTRFKNYMLALQATTKRDADRTALLIRELLDNKRRADSAGTWYLKPFLENLVGMVKAIPNWQSATDAEALALVYQLLGAINYFSISEPTLTAIFGTAQYKTLEKSYPLQLSHLIGASLSTREP